MNKIFFVVPVYKVEKYLGRCTESILAQTYENIEIVLVDDGSPDNCPELCDEYADKYPNIKVIHKENGGLSDARNAGIMYVRKVADDEDYITFVDSDDYIHADYARRMISLCEENGCNLSQCSYEKGSSDIFEKTNVDANVECKTAEEALLGYRIKSQVCAKVFKAKVFKDILFPVGVINEDEFTTYRAVYSAEKMAFTDENLYYYFQHGTGIMAEIAKNLKNNPRRYDFLKAYEERIKFFEEKKLPLQVMKTKEKICTDIILRYCEQMWLKKEDRDTDCVNGTYMKLYRHNFKEMIKRKGMPLKRRFMFHVFYVMPISGVIAGRILGMRK